MKEFNLVFAAFQIYINGEITVFGCLNFFAVAKQLIERAARSSQIYYGLIRYYICAGVIRYLKFL